MIEADLEFIKKVLKAGLIESPCLELGAGHEEHSTKFLIRDAGIEYFSTDIFSGNDVDFVVNFEDSKEVILESFKQVGMFSSILVLNVLEHTFDPIRILDNIFALLRSGGTCIIITPTVWPIHDFPIDCWRINPNFYEQYCQSRSLYLIEEYFEYIGFHNVNQNKDALGTYVLPSPSTNKTKTIVSRTVHKLFNTYGRGMSFPAHVATGVVIRK